ncbi:unnamed protein product [Pseudo-nitzschia multistriata]|uniref:Uncharacterized protein n=1 Tax=Pseudo-nitzschia multistriata TaxID=183589 RepID=A0A448Z0C6_9STRA|nr:unnamed protein product [Pseudo-nitzschia multistriata]
MGVTTRGKDLKNAVVNGQKCHVEGSTTQIKDQNVFFVVLLVESVRNGSGCGFVDNTLNFHACDGPGIFRCLPLGVVKVCGDGHYGMLDFRSEIGFGGFFHFS